MRCKTLQPSCAVYLPAAAAVGAGIPAEFVMKNTTKFADPMLAFADKGGELGELQGALLLGEVCCSV